MPLEQISHNYDELWEFLKSMLGIAIYRNQTMMLDRYGVSALFRHIHSAGKDGGLACVS